VGRKHFLDDARGHDMLMIANRITTRTK